MAPAETSGVQPTPRRRKRALISLRSVPWLRLGTDFVVIVVGVLTALLLEAWRGYAGDREMEAQYLAQIGFDLRRNRELLAEAISLERSHLELAQKIEEAMYLAAASHADSLRAWLSARREGAWWYSDPRLVDGTLSALVETGDLALVRDRGIRSAILGYLGQLRADSEEFRRFVQYQIDAESLLRARGEAGLSPGPPYGPERQVRRLLIARGDPMGRSAVTALEGAYRNRVWYLEQMLAATDSLAAAMGSR